MKRTTIFLFLLTGFASPSLLAEFPRWAVRAHPAVLAGLEHADLERGRISPTEVVEKLKAADFGNQLNSFLELCRRQGISEVVLDGVQPELKGIYFRSAELEKLGWVVLADVLGRLRTEAAKRNLQVGLSLSELGIHARGLYEEEYGLSAVKQLSVGGLGALCRGLADTYRLASLTEEEFPTLWFQPLQDLKQDLRFAYIHRVTADDVVGLSAGTQKTTPLHAFPESLVLSTRDVDRLLAPRVEAAVTNGTLPLFLSPEKIAVEVSDLHRGRLFLEGALLFRALQAAPETFTLAASRDTLTRMTPGLFRRAADLAGQHDASAPLLNLLVLGTPQTTRDAGQVAWLQLAANLEPLSLAFGAAGFRVRMTDRVLPDARAYYVYVAGNARTQWSECEAALAQRGRDVPVFVQLGSEPQKPLLDDLGRFLGFRSATWVNGIIPPVGLYKGRQMTFKGPDLYGGQVPAGYLQLAVDSPQVMMDASRSPLITVSASVPNRFFVNSNLIHRDVAFPLSHLLTSGRGLQRPAACFIAVGKKTAFWALTDGEVEWVHPRTGQRLVLEMKEGGFHLE
ncbi:MAG: hypothetical protein EHM23_21145 [Acidobacteria bacterium]|nr:MAG: hypothetical protein EHM23_21145 [Acidobacteriota bacterium]